MSKYNYVPTAEFIVVEREDAWKEEEKSKAGIILPSGQKQEAQDVCKVLAVGPTCKQVKPGMRVVAHPLTIMLSIVEGVIIYYIQEKNVLFILEDNKDYKGE